MQQGRLLIDLCFKILSQRFHYADNAQQLIELLVLVIYLLALVSDQVLGGGEVGDMLLSCFLELWYRLELVDDLSEGRVSLLDL